ncbi:MAG: ABC transporter substrate-binding protein [Beijerinckiaceae bacterium]
MTTIRTAVMASAVSMFAMITPALAQGQLNMICAPQIEWCVGLANAFTKETGVNVAVTQKSTGEILAQVRAEAQNPRIDIWFGGTTDPHLIAAEDNLTLAYTSKEMAKLRPWAVKLHEQSKQRSVGISIGSIGFGYNKELLAKKNIAPPKSWADLLKPEYKGEIQMANPNSSGTAYIVIATLVQIMGEDKAFDYLKRLHPNINAYTRSGVAPIKAAARGETGVSISFVMDIVTEQVAGFPVGYEYPSEGTGFEVAGLSIIKGARNLTQAQKFYDWYMTGPAQEIGAQFKQFHFPAHLDTKIDARVPDVSSVKLIDYDFAKYGTSAERRRLLAKWDAEIGTLPR